MDADPIKPLSFPVPVENAPVKRRAVFSDSVAQSQSRHVRPAEGGQTMPARRRRLHDDSLAHRRSHQPPHGSAVLGFEARPASALASVDVGDEVSGVRHVHHRRFLRVAVHRTAAFRPAQGRQAKPRQRAARDARPGRHAHERSQRSAQPGHGTIEEAGRHGEDSTLVNDEMVNGLVAVEGRASA